MIKKATDFIKNHWEAIFWTAVYLFAIYLFFKFFFRFDILSAADWNLVSRGRLHGIFGATFGILLISSPLIYITSLIVIRRTKKPFFKLGDIFKKKKAKPENKDNAQPDDTKKIPEIVYPTGLPEELREQYMRMTRGSLIQGASSSIANPITDKKIPAESAQAMVTADVKNESAQIETATGRHLPLPDDFGMEAAAPAAPIFKTINFDTPLFSNNDANIPELHSDICKKLSDMGFDVRQDDEIIIAHKDKTDPIAIAIHDDADFWVADGDNWFATGKQKISPVHRLTAAAKEHSAAAVLYLAECNIMDLDQMKEKWSKDDIKIIHDLNEIYPSEEEEI